MMLDLRTLTLHDALKGLAAGEFSTAELIREALLRIDAADARIEAWVEVKARQAMELALAADRRRSIRTPTAPLLGIPIGVKDIFDIAGMRTRCNMESRLECVEAARDSDAVHALRRDGAILLGKTVTQEAAAGVISDPARNPWDTDRIPGGSSGGSAAALAAGTCLGALGSDTAGSIRIPASVTGLAGLKPTWGRLSAKGVFPLAPTMDTVGPLGRTVHDAAILYLSLAGRPAEIRTLENRFPEAGGSLSGKRIGVLRSFFLNRVQPEVATAFQVAVVQLGELGAEIVECDWAEAEAARSVALITSRVESAAVHRKDLRHAPDLMGEALRSRVEVGAILTADTYLRTRQVRFALRDSIADVYGTHRLDAIVAPTLPATAPRADEEDIIYHDGSTEPVGTAFTRLTSPWNTTGQPVISVSCGFDQNRLPIGLSFIGRPDQELNLCDLAHSYERAAGWYRQTPDP